MHWVYYGMGVLCAGLASWILFWTHTGALHPFYWVIGTIWGLNAIGWVALGHWLKGTLA